MDRERFAVIFGSSCLRLPAAAFLAFAKSCLPDFILLSFNSLKSSFRIKTSPRISNRLGKVVVSSLKTRGIPLMVFKFVVISSPVFPSPRVDPLINFPFS